MHIDWPAQGRAQAFTYGDQIEHTEPLARAVDQQVDIAFGTSLIAGEGAKKKQAPNTQRRQFRLKKAQLKQEVLTGDQIMIGWICL